MALLTLRLYFCYFPAYDSHNKVCRKNSISIYGLSPCHFIGSKTTFY